MSKIYLSEVIDFNMLKNNCLNIVKVPCGGR